jgi:hypothetical protein|tara:strand:- start:1740 stop:2177 length:438 start_codon:yes stop_codon:yes gene_type:complete
MVMKKSYKGLYRPKNPKKYAGDPNRIVYRSMLERKFMVYCDNNPKITYWASEELSVKYKSPIDQRIHRYFPDFLVKTIQDKIMMIEIKPFRQCKPPAKPKRKTKSYLRAQLEYAKNKAKWKAATQLAEQKNITFKILTEKDLGVY